MLHIYVPAPVCLPSECGECGLSLSDTENKDSKYQPRIVNCLKKERAYRRGSDDSGAERNEAEVDEEGKVEKSEVAEGRHLLAIGVHEDGPESNVIRGNDLANSSHVEKHEETNGSPDGDELIGHEEGDVGDGNVEEGGHQSGDDDALHSPPKVNMNP